MQSRFIAEQTDEPENISYFETLAPTRQIAVEIAGAVVKPDVYEVAQNTRLKDILAKAGGLSQDADSTFFHRNFNLARVVKDQEKYYVPSVYEIGEGLYSESLRTVETGIQTYATMEPQTNLTPKRVSMNAATVAELDSLPGIGAITAQKIIQNRPYTSVNELIEKKVVKNATFNAIRDLITL